MKKTDQTWGVVKTRGSLVVIAWESRTIGATSLYSSMDFANAFVSISVNSRAELVASPQAYARNGAPRRWLGN